MRDLKLKIAAFSFAALLLAPCAPQAGEPAPAKIVDEPTLQLGKITVSGQYQIVRTLRVIKVALRTPFSNDPAHANDVVCRINKGLGEQHEYLDCAANRDYTRRRDAVQTAGIVGTTGLPGGGDIQMFNALITAQPNHQLHVPVQGGALQALLARIPDDATLAAPAGATESAPAAGTPHTL